MLSFFLKTRCSDLASCVLTEVSANNFLGWKEKVYWLKTNRQRELKAHSCFFEKEKARLKSLTHYSSRESDERLPQESFGTRLVQMYKGTEVFMCSLHWMLHREPLKPIVTAANSSQNVIYHICHAPLFPYWNYFIGASKIWTELTDYKSCWSNLSIQENRKTSFFCLHLCLQILG